jgi:hypothetical protein
MITQSSQIAHQAVSCSIFQLRWNITESRVIHNRCHKFRNSEPFAAFGAQLFRHIVHCHSKVVWQLSPRLWAQEYMLLAAAQATTKRAHHKDIVSLLKKKKK